MTFPNGLSHAHGEMRAGAYWSSRRLLTRFGLLDAIVFIAPLLRFVDVTIFGRLFLTEVLLAALFPSLLVRRGYRLATPLPRTLIGLLLLWLLGQIATDLIRGSSFNDYARGWAMIGFALINFCSLFLLMAGNPKRLVLFAAGAAIGQIADYFIAPGNYALAHPWKFGYGTGVSWLLVLILAVALPERLHPGRLWPSVVLLFVAALNMFMGSRAVGGVAFLAACYLGAQVLRGTRSTSSQIQFRQLLAVGALAGLGAWTILQIYEYSVAAGWLGTEARQKYEMQASGEYGLLIGGRTEVLVSGLAILDAPVIGHGSWAKDCRYSSLYVELKRRAGYFPGEEDEECLIPAHSHLMGAWVQAGILGAIFWLWLLTLPMRALAGLFTVKERLAPLVALLAFHLIWDTFFSPFAGERRFITPFYIVLMMSFIPSVRRRRAQSKVATTKATANPQSESYR
ncbi:hypothetical protein [Algiphilus sp.]|uniref:hypothetical protein n=1 Tax=Algiphilus sp. TaxID=1872431 RepID=UPI003B526D42